MIESPPADHQKRPQDEISRVQKVAAVEKVFCCSPRRFHGIRVYIGEGSRSVELRGAHEGGGRDLLPRGFLVAFLTSTPSLLDCVCSKNNPRKGFIPFDIPFLRNTETGKKTAIWARPPVNRLVPKII